MTILAVDDEKLALNSLISAIKKAMPMANIFDFRSAEDAIESMHTIKIDIAFLDINLRGMSGLELALNLKKIQPDINIVFVTAYSEYAVTAFDLNASGYILKPVTEQKVKKILKNLRNPIEIWDKNKLCVQCFGTFQIYMNDTPVKFTRHKSLELLAFLISKCGSSCTISQISSILWEDGKYNISRKNQIHNYLSDIKKSLSVINMEEVLVCHYNSYSVNTSLIDCDLYKFLNGDIVAVNNYKGKYMVQYTWAKLNEAIKIKTTMQLQ